RQAQQARHRHLLVDELQDLTPAHVLMIRLLATPGLDVFGVGDDDQVIYGHAGADPSVLIDFGRLFPGAASHPLEVNYRCPEVVVGAARHLLSYNDRRVAKEIRPGPHAAIGSDRLVIRRHRSQEGGTAVLATVRGWLDDGARPATIAVLARVNSLLLAPHVVLAQAGVPIDSAADPSILERTGVRAALAYLRIASSPRGFSPDDVNEVLRRPSRGLPQWISKWFRGRSMSVGDVRAVASRLDDFKVAAKVESLADDLDLVAKAAAGGGSARDVLIAVKEQVGLGSAMGLLDATGPAGSGSHLDDLEALLQVADLHPDPGGFEPWLRSVFRREAAAGGITVSTVHRVKGMEWDRVAVFGVADGIVPHRLADDVEEERRVLHVAITRGREHIAVLVDQDRPSPFLGELDGTAARGDVKPPGRVPAAPATATSGTKTGMSSDDLQASLPAEAAAVFAALREWRTAKAKQEKVSAFIVAPNRLLHAIALARPTTMVELSHVHEMGARRLESYGDEILSVVAGTEAGQI
ncbi:MAG: 3'-5' exonuclease, partial [Actinomycetota bacterium]